MEVEMNPKFGQELLHSIAGLKEEQAKLRAQKKKVTKDLRNAEKKRLACKKKLASCRTRTW